jgi:hypothetical protein
MYELKPRYRNSLNEEALLEAPILKEPILLAMLGLLHVK